MTYLIAIIVAIALTSSVMFLYSSSLNERPFVVQNERIQIENKFNILQIGYRNHLSYHGYKLNSDSWNDDISNYINIPTLKYNYTFDYNSNSNGYYFCMISNTPVNLDNAYFDAIKELSIDNEYMFLSNECGANENIELTNNSVVALTFFVGR